MERLIHADVRVPFACTLPESEQCSRLDDFDALFADEVNSADLVHETQLQLDLKPTPTTASRAAELVTKESACCSFFTFTLTVREGHLQLNVAVPRQYQEVLRALFSRVPKSVRVEG